MKTLLKGHAVNVACRLILGGIFLFAAWHKVLHPEQFAISVRSYQFLPVSITNLFALGVAWTELVAGVMLVAGVLTRHAAGALMILLGMFIVAITTVIVKGLVIDCGCFGPDGHSSLVSPWMLVRNVLLAAAAWIIIEYHDGFLAVWPGRRH